MSSIKIETGKKFSGTMDMGFAGSAMIKKPRMLNHFTMGLFAQEFPFTWGLLQFLGENVDDSEVLDSNTYTIGSIGLNNKSVYIHSYSGTPKVDQQFFITLSDGWLKHGAVCTLGDGITKIRLDDDGVTLGNQTTYKAQAIGNNASGVIPDYLLAAGEPVNFEYSAYGEASKTGHPVYWNTGDIYKNIMTTVRSKVQWTGDFLSEGTIFEVQEDGKDAVYRGFLPGTAGFYRTHMAWINNAMLHGSANFDPITGKVYTTTSYDEKTEVSMGSGLYETVRNVGVQMSYSPKEVLTGRRTMSSILDEAIAQAAKYTGEEFIGMIALGGQLAIRCVEKANKEKLVTENIQLTLMLNGTEKSISTKGLYAKYQSTFGELQIMWNREPDKADKKFSSRHLISVDGTSYPDLSGDLIIIPIIKFKDKDGKTKPSIKLISKGKTSGGITMDRRLVFGFHRGMTGLTNSVFGKNNTAFLKQFKEFMTSSMIDADQSELLSQMMLVLHNADKCIYLKAKNI